MNERLSHGALQVFDCSAGALSCDAVSVSHKSTGKIPVTTVDVRSPGIQVDIQEQEYRRGF